MKSHIDPQENQSNNNSERNQDHEDSIDSQNEEADETVSFIDQLSATSGKGEIWFFKSAGHA